MHSSLADHWVNNHSVVIVDNAAIHHVESAANLIQNHIVFLPPYPPDLNPIKEDFTQVKSILIQNDVYFQVCQDPRTNFIWNGVKYIQHSGYEQLLVFLKFLLHCHGSLSLISGSQTSLACLA